MKATVNGLEHRIRWQYDQVPVHVKGEPLTYELFHPAVDSYIDEESNEEVPAQEAWTERALVTTTETACIAQIGELTVTATIKKYHKDRFDKHFARKESLRRLLIELFPGTHPKAKADRKIFWDLYNNRSKKGRVPATDDATPLATSSVG